MSDLICQYVRAITFRVPDELATNSGLLPRHIAWYMAHEYERWPYREIGAAVGRPHGTVAYGVLRVAHKIPRNPDVAQFVAAQLERCA